MRRLLIALALLLAASSAKAQPYTQAQLDALIISMLPTNGQQQITAANLRAVLNPMVSATFNPGGPIDMGGNAITGGGALSATTYGITGASGVFAAGPTSPVAGSTLAANWIWGTSAAYADLVGQGGLWSGAVDVGLGISKQIHGICNNINTGPCAALFVYADVAASSGDGVGAVFDTNVETSNGTGFGINPIARSGGGGLTNVKLVGAEIDIEPAVGDTVSAASVGLAMNAFSTAIPLGIQFGGLGGGSWDNGVYCNNINFGCLVAAGGTSMKWQVNTGSATYTGLGAIMVNNGHKIALGDVGNANAGVIYSDGSSNIRQTLGSGGSWGVRNQADNANLFLVHSTGAIENFGAFGQNGAYGTSGQVLTSGGGSSNPWSWTTPKQTVGGSSGNQTVAAGLTRYFGSGCASTVSSACGALSGITGTFKKLYVQVGTVPGGSETQTLTLNVNGSDTSITCTISAAAGSCNDTAHTAAITAGQLYSVKVVSSGGAATTQYMWGAELDSP